MTPLVEELSAFPVRGVFDGELVAFEDGQVDFVALTDRILLRSRDAPIAFIVFDVLYVDGSSTIREPYRKRRSILETLDLAGPHWAMTPCFDDADALWRVVVRDGLEGVVAKPRGSVYRPGVRLAQDQEPRLLEVRRRTRIRRVRTAAESCVTHIA